MVLWFLKKRHKNIDNLAALKLLGKNPMTVVHNRGERGNNEISVLHFMRQEITCFSVEQCNKEGNEDNIVPLASLSGSTPPFFTAKPPS